MFVELFFKEMKQTLKCLTYYVLVLCIILFCITQSGEFEMIQEPKLGQQDYGINYSQDETVIMEMTLQTLVLEYVQNIYITYPIGFYKTVSLNDEKQLKMGELLTEIIGVGKDELAEIVKGYFSEDITHVNQITYAVSKNLSYKQFLVLMKQADKLLGGGSNYSSSFIKSNAQVPMTYEDAMKEYKDITTKDHLSGAYARLFSDYIGIVLAILPVFLAVTRGLRDKRAQASQVIYVRKVTSFQIIMSRYLAMIISILIPVIILAAIIALQCSYNGASSGIAVDNFAFIKYITGWLLPSIMITISVGVVLTELTETALAIVVQALWWFVSIFMGIVNMRGGYGLNMIPRHNTLGNYQVFHDNFQVLVINRISYAAAAVILILAAVIIYDWKRRGKLHVHGKILSNRKSKSEV